MRLGMLYPTTCVRLRYGFPADGLSGFSRRLGYARYPIVPKDAGYSRGRLPARTSLHRSAPTPFNLLFRQEAALSLPRLRVAPQASTGILTGSAIGFSHRMSLRTRLTLIRLPLIRKPWSCGEGGSRPLSRYSYLHLLFHTLQRGSRPAFHAEWNAPLPAATTRPHCFGRRLIPDYHPRRIPRLVSCYALFEWMAASKPTS